MVTNSFQKKIKAITKKLLYLPNLPFDYFFFLIHGIKWHHDWKLLGWPLIQRKKGSTIEIGSRFRAVSKSRYNSWGIIQPVIIKARRSGCLIKIGDDVGFSGCTITALEKIIIGNDVLVGTGAIISDNDAHSINPLNRRYSENVKSKPIIIKDNVFIGARAIILKGTTIGTGAVIAAGSIVVSDVPEFAIFAGNPAKKIGDCRNK